MSGWLTRILIRWRRNIHTQREGGDRVLCRVYSFASLGANPVTVEEEAELNRILGERGGGCSTAAILQECALSPPSSRRNKKRMRIFAATAGVSAPIPVPIESIFFK